MSLDKESACTTDLSENTSECFSSVLRTFTWTNRKTKREGVCLVGVYQLTWSGGILTTIN